MRFFRRSKQAAEVAEKELPAGEAVALEQESIAAAEDEQLEEEIERQTEQALQRTRKGIFGQIAGLFDRGGDFDESLWEDLEDLLIGADAGIATTQRILGDLRERVTKEKIKDAEAVRRALKQELVDILNGPQGTGGLWSGGDAPPPKPAVVLVLGVNGTGKTTTIAKMASAYQSEGSKVVIAAGDTFRAAAIDQLREWGERIEVDVVAHQPGADPGAVVFDALTAAESRAADIVIIDTAGRLHTKFNLMEELRKLRRVIERKDPGAPHEVLLVLDATTGQNGLIQAKAFTEAVDVTSVCLTKLDGSSKGGIVFAICDQLGIPVRFVGTGEGANDLAPFSAEAFVEALFR
jgi:fused signal recognition particle receptor